MISAAPVKEYVQAKIDLTACQQKQFRQVCHACSKYATCQVYAEYVDKWIRLQDSVKEQPTRVVNIWYEGCDVYIGRGSKWGNKFEIGKDGTREEVVDKYLDWILTQPKLLDSLHELKGKRLGCWCAPKLCHGYVLVALILELGI